MAKRKKDEEEVERAARNLGAPTRRKKKATALRSPIDGTLYCPDHTEQADLEGVALDTVEVKEGDTCIICGLDLTTGKKGKAKSKRHLNRKTYDKQVRTMLEGEDREQALKDLLANMKHLDEQEQARKQVMAEWKGIIQQAEEDVQSARAVLEQGRVEVVRVLEVTDYDNGTVTISREDNDTVLEERELTEDEKQRPLEGLEDGDSPAMDPGDPAEPRHDGKLPVED